MTEISTETTETTETQEEGSTLEQDFESLDVLQQRIHDAEVEYETKLLEMAKKSGKTLQFRGAWYQVCTRKSEKLGRDMVFLKKLKGNPKTWLKGMPKGGWPKAEAAVTETVPAEPVVTQPTETVDEFIQATENILGGTVVFAEDTSGSAEGTEVSWGSDFEPSND